MVKRIYKLYLLRVRLQTVAIIPAKNAFDAISKYITRTGFDRIYAYFYNYLMTNTAEIDSGTSNIGKYYFITTGTKTVNSGILSISSEQVRSCDGIFSWIDPEDIANNPLLVKPTIEEVRNCIGFSREPMYKLRKFCI